MVLVVDEPVRGGRIQEALLEVEMVGSIDQERGQRTCLALRLTEGT